MTRCTLGPWTKGSERRRGKESCNRRSSICLCSVRAGTRLRTLSLSLPFGPRGARLSDSGTTFLKCSKNELKRTSGQARVDIYLNLHLRPVHGPSLPLVETPCRSPTRLYYCGGTLTRYPCRSHGPRIIREPFSRVTMTRVSRFPGIFERPGCRSKEMSISLSGSLLTVTGHKGYPFLFSTKS